MITTASFYDARAEKLGARYANTAFEDVHANLIAHLPSPGTGVIDVGAGSGRDAYALAALGYRVTAVEPSKGMRTYGMADQYAGDVRWFDDALPALLKVRSEASRYTFVLCSAVLMHVTSRDLSASMEALAEIATPGGKIAISLRAPTIADPANIFHCHSSAAVLKATQQVGLGLVDKGDDNDVFGRERIQWRWWVLEKRL